MVPIYTLWLATSSVSLFASLLTVMNIAAHPTAWKKMFHQLSLVLAVFDILACVSTLREKDSDDALCRAQEYILQFALLGKAATTLTICHVSTRTLRDMEVLSTKYVFSHLGVTMLGAVACIGVSIYFDTGWLWCGANSFRAFYLTTSGTEIVYMGAFLLPIMLCIVVNTYYYISISRDLEGRRAFRAATASDSTEDIDNVRHAEETKLYRVIKNIRFYPIVLAVCFLPEAVAVVHSLVTGDFEPVLYRIATVSLGLSGFFMAINYFRQQKLHPNLQQITFRLQEPVFFMGRNLSSLMAWSEGHQTESSGTRNPLADSQMSSGVTMTDSSYRGGESSYMTESVRSSVDRCSDMSEGDVKFKVFL